MTYELEVNVKLDILKLFISWVEDTGTDLDGSISQDESNARLDFEDWLTQRIDESTDAVTMLLPTINVESHTTSYWDVSVDWDKLLRVTRVKLGSKPSVVPAQQDVLPGLE